MLRRVAAVGVVLATAGAQCSNQCNAKGTCDIYGRCTCFSGYTGGDCSLRTCPAAEAWADPATGDAECSARGACNRDTGACECMAGFTGEACERMACDFGCYGRGKCLSMRTMASTGSSLDTSQRFAYTTPWDAEKVFGCVCDEPYTTHDCGQRKCPAGDDPLTTGQANEVQLLRCLATAGSFTLLFEGKATGDIPFDATAAEVKAAIEAAVTVEDVVVTFSIPTGTVCQSNRVNVVQVEFLTNFGPLRPLVAIQSALSGTVTISADGSTLFVDSRSNAFVSVKGTKENDQCSNRGLCDVFLATCTCVDTNSDAYASSDGYGNAGTRGDCGHALSTIATCPGEVECSGQGVCDRTSYRCACEEGWAGADCSLKACPAGLSWFNYPTASNAAHDVRTECSDGGTCDRTTGLCACSDKFYGAACEYLACPGGMSNKCSGHGSCLSMAELALAAETANGASTDFAYGTDPNAAATWDAHRVFGCDCDEGWAGYDCALRSCPRGDDPGTYGQVNEVQLLRCLASSGSFALTFRQQATAPIAWDAAAEDVQAALEALSTIGRLNVTYASGNTALCVDSSGTANTVRVEFYTEHADLPDLVPDVALLVDSDFGASLGTGTVDVASDGETLGGLLSQRGTTESEECSNRGICDRTTGVCQCFPGYASSDGQGQMGTQADCGYRNRCSLADVWCTPS